MRVARVDQALLQKLSEVPVPVKGPASDEVLRQWTLMRLMSAWEVVGSAKDIFLKTAGRQLKSR